ncbi:MAG: hypothetical protein C4576_24685 [Desulfobacteraceae bacterium]|nr:MAG: hypothetical protein C4576_24685 [Desulfobacteraceae bacterium]
MRVAIIQSSYIPWKGYFDIIHDCDLFIFLDCVQYTKRDWRSRNQIKTADGLKWLSIPVGDNCRRMINEVTINDPKWQTVHWKTIERFYSKASFYHRYKDLFRDIYLNSRWTSLSQLNQFLIQTICREILSVTTLFSVAASYPAASSKSDLILSLCKTANATEYVTGPKAKAYLNESQFHDEGIDITYKDYSQYPEYRQFYPPFVHTVSILDLIFHNGPNSSYFIWGWRS